MSLQNACFQYWPTHNQEVHRGNDVSLELISEESYHGYMERCLKITLQVKHECYPFCEISQNG